MRHSFCAPNDRDAALFKPLEPDVFQLLGLSFMALIAGAVVNPDVSFSSSSWATLFAIWALVLLHLQRDMEALAADSSDPQEEENNWQSRTLIRGRFLMGTSVLALAVLISSAAFFFLFPRLGMGFFFGQGRGGQKVSGFSDELELGHFGTIKNDMNVIMRVEYPQDRRPLPPGSTTRHLVRPLRR